MTLIKIAEPLITILDISVLVNPLMLSYSSVDDDGFFVIKASVTRVAPPQLYARSNPTSRISLWPIYILQLWKAYRHTGLWKANTILQILLA